MEIALGRLPERVYSSNERAFAVAATESSHNEFATVRQTSGCADVCAARSLAFEAAGTLTQTHRHGGRRNFALIESDPSWRFSLQLTDALANLKT
jgi:hypothetical protein